MNSNKRQLLFIAGTLSICAALAHIAVIFGGPDWYRAFGAGEQMAIMAEQGKLYPTLITLLIASILSVWGLYAYSGARLIPRLPLLKTCLILITAVYCIRGSYGFFLPFISSNEHVQAMGLGFWFLSSSICLLIGILHVAALKQSWHNLKHTST